MNKTPLSEKEFEIINVIADGFRSNQRVLSTHIGLSLGMTNLLLRRLATKGYLRMKQLDRKKVDYLLTPRGLAEKAQKSYHYTLKTLESFGLIKRELRNILEPRLLPSIRNIIILGKGDLTDLVSLILQQTGHGRWPIIYQDTPPVQLSSDTLILDTTPRQPYEITKLPSDRVDIVALLATAMSSRSVSSKGRELSYERG